VHQTPAPGASSIAESAAGLRPEEKKKRKKKKKKREK
jgi:hypothetical protein